MSRFSPRGRYLFVLLSVALCVGQQVGAYQLRSNQLAQRQILGLPVDSTTVGTTSTRENTATNTNTATQNTDTNITPTTTHTTNTQTTAITDTQTNQNPPTTTIGTTSNGNTQTTAPANTNTQTQAQAQTQTQDTQTNTGPPQPSDTIVSTTDVNGSPVVVTIVVTPSASSVAASASASASESAEADRNSDDGISTGSIIGMSVAGGIAVLGVIAFFVWKFTRKRYTDFDDEPIKWPELNSHANDNLNYELPTDRPKLGAGAGLDSASEVNLGRNVSNAGLSAYSQPSAYSHPSAADSTADLYAPGGDPYAVPPLPHLNPNQPYRDDPGFGGAAAGTYYNPYRGPIPQTFNDTASVASVGQHGEAIPMNNLGAIPAGRRSPGPQMALDPGRAISPQPPMAGRQSPGPSLAYGGRTTPGAGPVMAGRQSPGPAAVYGGGH